MKKKKTYLEITLRRSLIGTPDKLRRVAKGMGLAKMNRTVVLVDTPSTRGMIAKINHLVEAKEVGNT
jgi:large subunit ribosomal protein L30